MRTIVRLFVNVMSAATLATLATVMVYPRPNETDNARSFGVRSVRPKGCSFGTCYRFGKARAGESLQLVSFVCEMRSTISASRGLRS